MSDSTTNQPIRVLTAGTAGSYVRLPKDQVDEVCKLLETNGIRFWVAHLSISVNGMPFVSTINLRLGTNPEEVQTLLDAVA